MTGTAVSQLLGIAVSPLLARLYSPQDYAVLALFSSFLGIGAVLAPLRFDQIVAIPGSELEARSAVGVAIILTVTAGLFVILPVLVIYWLQPIQFSSVHAYLWLAPFGLVAIGIYQTLQGWLLRTGDYMTLSRLRWRQSTVAIVTSVGLGLSISGAWGLVIGQIAQLFTGVLGEANKFRRPQTGNRGIFGKSIELRQTFARYVGLAAGSAGAGVLNAISAALPPILLIAAYGAEVAGSFSFAFRIISVPMALIGTAASQLFMGEASRLLRDGNRNLIPLFNDATRKLMWVGVAMGVAGIISPFGFPLVFGSKWGAAGMYGLMLSWVCAFQIVVSPVSVIALLKKRQDVQIYLDCLRITAVSVALYLPAKLKLGPTATVAAYSFAMVFTYLISFIWYHKLAHGSDIKFGETALDQSNGEKRIV